MLSVCALVLGITAATVAQQQDLPAHLRDRGRDVRTSEFQTYINGFGLASKSTDWEPQLGIRLEIP